jgi:hypothetical protein
MEDLRDGHSAPHEAMAFAELSGRVLDTVEMEMKHEAFKRSVENRKNAGFIEHREEKIAIDGVYEAMPDVSGTD